MLCLIMKCAVMESLDRVNLFLDWSENLNQHHNSETSHGGVESQALHV